MKRSIIYKLLKFANKEQSINLIQEKLEERPDKESILDYLRSLNERDCAKATGFIMGKIKKSDLFSLEEIVGIFSKEDRPESVSKNTKAIIIADDLNRAEQDDLNIIIQDDKFKKWVIERFSDAKSKEEIHPLKDCLPTLISYQKNYQNIAQSYTGTTETNLKFRAEIDDQFFPNSRSWNTPADISNLTIDDMVSILDIFYSQNRTHRYSEKLPQEDFIGKVGEWNLWLPSSRENSIRICLDMETKKSKTTWCTCRTEGNNLFYNYIGGTDGNLILFYIIKDNPSGNNDWLSLGYQNGSPFFNGRGGVSVDRDNNGLTENRLQEILGGNYQKIMSVLQSKQESLNGVSPALKKINEAAQSLIKYKELIKGNIEEDRVIVSSKVAENSNISPEVQLQLAKDSETYVRRSLAKNSNISPEVQLQLAKDSETYVRRSLADNGNIFPEVQLQLAKDSNADIRENLAENSNISPEVQLQLAKDIMTHVRGNLAKNSNISPEIQLQLAKDSMTHVRGDLAKNSNISPEIQLQLAKDSHEYVRGNLAKNSNISPEIQLQLAKDSETYVRRKLAESSNISPEVQLQLAKDSDEYVRENLAENSNLTIEAKAILNSFSKEAKISNSVNKIYKKAFLYYIMSKLSSTDLR